ncbi:MAG: 30S ribosomal protein S4 [Hadesarchaea archaeon]|nr:MAG: 30S ribosomal protein S4 [Hadesarchaea archaeon]
MKRQRKKYSRPLHPWDKTRMDAEDALLKKYGLRRKKEIWKMAAILRGWRRQARRLLALSGRQAELETRQLLERLRKFGLVGENATLDDVLSLTLEDLLERRLQTVLFRKGMARTPRQARQLIVHGHVSIGGQRVRVPSYLVSTEEEGKVECSLQVPPPPAPPEAPQGGEG